MSLSSGIHLSLDKRGAYDTTGVKLPGTPPPPPKALGTVNTEGDFGSFLTKFGIAIGWEDILVEDLPLIWDKPGPREYGACFKVSFIVDAKTRSNPSNMGKRFAIMRDIAKCAAIHYACPLCMKGFANPDRVLKHCGEEKDDHHKSLLSEEQSEFLEVYETSMGQHTECDTIKIQYNEYGRPYFGECFQLDEILKYKPSPLPPPFWCTQILISLESIMADVKLGDHPDSGRVHSASFVSTTRDIESIQTDARTAQYGLDRTLQPLNYNWRADEDIKSISRLGTFGSGKTYYPEGIEIPLCDSWEFRPKDIKTETCGSVAGKLLVESSNKVKRIPFGSMVQYAVEFHSLELQTAFREYEWIHSKIYYYFVRRRKRAELLLSVKEELNANGSDKFIIAVIQHVYDCVQKRKLSDVDLITPLRHFITRPLENHLQKPTSAKAIWHQLQLLELRFNRYIDGDWKIPLDTRTDFLEDFLPLSYAENLTEIDHDLYLNLSIKSFEKRDGEEKKALTTLIARSDSLVWLALSYLRNFYSVDAIKTGVMAAISSEVIPNNSKLIEQLDGLFDFEKELGETKPCLLPLLRARKCVEHGISGFGARLIQWSKAYSPTYTTMPSIIAIPCKAASPMRSSFLQDIQCGKTAPELSNPRENVPSYPQKADSNPQLSQNDKMVYSPLVQSKEIDNSQALKPSLNIFSLFSFPWRCLGG
ncbi:hypothetical protein NUU61_001395 [Penicillium alfredii]|uniref:Uncharacterized protein n=1 Tax=Penicillium alfredii TaxID=1506179 RepID=A0A9W9KML2_9EURO|nr:uncharacterized protein NUU61_001395 [Penicillium alfredii]KAJ5111765.1 hypothetical protein NUU61_001395 [Penicillium alfredii]